DGAGFRLFGNLPAARGTAGEAAGRIQEQAPFVSSGAITEPLISRANAVRFIVALGLISLLADVTYEGARSITGPFLGSLGASASMMRWPSLAPFSVPWWSRPGWPGRINILVVSLCWPYPRGLRSQHC